MTKRKPSKTRLLRVLQTIKDNPTHWNQETWHCETSHCFAGLAQLDKYNTPLDKYVCSPIGDIKLYKELYKLEDDQIVKFTRQAKDEAREYLGLTKTQANILFDAYNTLDILETIIQELIKGTPTRKINKIVDNLQEQL